MHTSAHHLAAAEQRYLVEQRGGSAHGLLHPGPTARGWLPLCFLALVRPWAAPSSVAGTLPVKRAGAVLAAPLLVLSTLSQAAPLRPGAHPLHAWVWASVFLARPRRHFSLPPLQRAWHLSFGSALLGALVPKT